MHKLISNGVNYCVDVAVERVVVDITIGSVDVATISVAGAISGMDVPAPRLFSVEVAVAVPVISETEEVAVGNVTVSKTGVVVAAAEITGSEEI